MCAWLSSWFSLQVLFFIGRDLWLEFAGSSGDLSRGSYGYVDYGLDHSVCLYDHEPSHWASFAVCAPVWHT